MNPEDIRWQKSTFSQGTGECIEIAAASDHILIRESDDPAAVITAERHKLRALVLGIKTGELHRRRSAF